SNTMAPLGVAVHPTQSYELLWDVAVFALLFWVFRGRLKPAGSLLGVYLVLYSVGAFGIRFLRGDTHAIFDGIHEGQIIALSLVLIIVPLLIWKTRWVSKRHSLEDESPGVGETSAVSET
ncbi:MAG: prolipoprotein diacylglyceryl transferase family protein, partial [Chloroflexota bacterium]